MDLDLQWHLVNTVFMSENSILIESSNRKEKLSKVLVHHKQSASLFSKSYRGSTVKTTFIHSYNVRKKHDILSQRERENIENPFFNHPLVNAIPNDQSNFVNNSFVNFSKR